MRYLSNVEHQTMQEYAYILKSAEVRFQRYATQESDDNHKGFWHASFIKKICRYRLAVLLFIIIIANMAIVAKLWYGGARFMTYGSARSVCCGGTLSFTAPLVCDISATQGRFDQDQLGWLNE